MSVAVLDPAVRRGVVGQDVNAAARKVRFESGKVVRLDTLGKIENDLPDGGLLRRRRTLGERLPRKQRGRQQPAVRIRSMVGVGVLIGNPGPDRLSKIGDLRPFRHDGRLRPRRTDGVGTT